MIYTHSHVDHYGGVRGVIDEADVKAGKVAVIAPDGFMEAVSGENVLAGLPMARRAQFQFGTMLPRGPRGQVDAGLGKGIARGSTGLIAPTMSIAQPVEEHTIDGIRIVFQLAPETEAPAEMHMFYPELGVLNMAENACPLLHNFIPLRGAVARDPRIWAKYIGDAIAMYAPQTDVMIGQHHWPVWGREAVARSSRSAARPLQAHPRPDAAPDEQGLAAGRDRRGDRPAAGTGRALDGARLLRLGQPQREGGLPALSLLVRRQPLQSPSAAAGAAPPPSSSSTWAAPRRSSRAPRPISPRASTAGSRR